LKDAVEHDHPQDLVEAVRAALHDPFLPVREVAEQLVGTFDLTQFQADIQTEAQSAPMAQDREAAQQVLEQLRRQR
jgi:hypothetical protein